MKIHMSWNDRFALIEKYKPNDAQIMSSLNVTKDELDFAREMRSNGYFVPSIDVDFDHYDGIFTGTMKQLEINKPVMTTKKIKVKKRRGRKGDKIIQALNAVPTIPVDVETFSKQYGISVPVLRQSKRFIAAMDKSVASTMGTINVRKDKKTKNLMIWKS